MSWRRSRSKGSPPLKPFPKWSSLKEGDIVVMKDGPCARVRVHRSKQTYVNGGTKTTFYHKKGMFLALTTAETFWVELDDVGVRGELIRRPT